MLVRLAARKLDAEDVRQWHRYLDWFLDLPRDINIQVYAQAQAQTGEQGMPFITFPERYGRQQGLLAGIGTALRIKFGAQGEALLPRVQQIEEPEQLDSFLKAVEQATDVSEVAKHLPPSTTDTGNGSAP